MTAAAVMGAECTACGEQLPYAAWLGDEPCLSCVAKGLTAPPRPVAAPPRRRWYPCRCCGTRMPETTLTALGHCAKCDRHLRAFARLDRMRRGPRAIFRAWLAVRRFAPPPPARAVRARAASVQEVA